MIYRHDIEKLNPFIFLRVKKSKIELNFNIQLLKKLYSNSNSTDFSPSHLSMLKMILNHVGGD